MIETAVTQNEYIGKIKDFPTCKMLLKGADKMAKNVGLNQDSNQGPSREKKSDNFLPKALPLSY
jgi:hypothetical protein